MSVPLDRTWGSEPAEADADAVAGPTAPPFASALYRSRASRSRDRSADPPAFAADLNLDQICEALTGGREEYELPAFFYDPLRDVDDILYRQEVLQELEREDVSGPVYSFGERMRHVRKQLTLVRKLRDPHQRERWFLTAVEGYLEAVTALDADLDQVQFSAQALQGLKAYLHDYLASDALKKLSAETAELARELQAINYQVLIDNLRVTVSPYEQAPDLTKQLEETFERFRQGKVEEHRVKFPRRLETNQVEERILEKIAEIFPREFTHAANFVKSRRNFLDTTIARFDREVQFYLAYLEYIAPLRQRGLEFSYPAVSTTDKRMHVKDGFDLALARKLHDGGDTIVCNDLDLEGQERVIVVSGPNQGGKTTFARMFGQLNHLAALGLPVPGADTVIYIPDQLFTHFEREEDLSTLRGKFEDELIRLHEILQLATGESVLIMNESFSSTTLHDGRWVGERILKQVIERDMVCLCVTFIDELATLGETVVSMMSTVKPDDPAERTFQVIRKPADGRAYATALAEKHRISYEQLSQRIKA